jgi:hypothetical protein
MRREAWCVVRVTIAFVVGLKRPHFCRRVPCAGPAADKNANSRYPAKSSVSRRKCHALERVTLTRKNKVLVDVHRPAKSPESEIRGESEVQNPKACVGESVRAALFLRQAEALQKRLHLRAPPAPV